MRMLRCLLFFLVAACGTREGGTLGPDDAAAPKDAVPPTMDGGFAYDVGDDGDGGLVCSGRSEADCKATAGCAAYYCTPCGKRFFSACGLPGEPQVCPNFCPAPDADSGRTNAG